MKIRSLLLVFFFPLGLSAQMITQTIRGVVNDKQSGAPLPGATVVLLNSNPVAGTTTDMNGIFRIEKVPVGRQSIQISYIGYNTNTLNNINVVSGKETVLVLELEEKVITTKEVEIVAERDKLTTRNDMTTVSARTFSVEESQRYAGSMNDVSRMASNFAGVRGGDDSRNDLIIRGNSSTGVLYRLEGVDIQNPNHFGGFGTTGGPVSMLNNNLLTNSDFMTGAFPAEYGNALSGIFDLKMRSGNNEKHEFLGQISMGGAEFLAEGPLSRAKRSSYLLSYRYSTLELFKALGVDFGTSSVPKYQDMAFRLNFPHKKGTTSFFGMGGLSDISLLDSDRDTTKSSNIYGDEGQDIIFSSKLGVAGLSHTHLLNNTTYLKLILSASVNTNRTINDTLRAGDRTPIPVYRNSFLQDKLSAHLIFNKKISAKHNIRMGVIMDRLGFDMTDSTLSNMYNRFTTLTNFNGYAYLGQAYCQWKYRITENLSFTPGIHFQRFTYNNTYAMEPRAGLSWKLASNHTIGLGYGFHSQMQPITVYFSQVEPYPGTYVRPNKNTGFTKSQHYVLSYDWVLSTHMRFKFESYYQHLYNVPVDVKPGNFSMLNQGANFFVATPDTVANNGTGTNYGAELTLERFLAKGFYFLLTSSLYNSTYKGSDAIERSTAFNGGYVFNLLAGKEIVLNKKKNTDASTQKALYVLSFDGKVARYGGQRYTPIDLAASRLINSAVYEQDKAYSLHYKDYFRADLRVGLKKNGKKISQEWGIDIQNVLNIKNIFYQAYNKRTGEIQTVYQIGILPVGLYRIMF